MIYKIPRWVLAGGGILAFSAGMINAITMLGISHLGVTHATGNISHLAIAITQSDYGLEWEMLFILMSFFGGAVLSGIILHDAHLKLGQSYGWALGIESVLLFVSAYAFSRGSMWGSYCASMAAGLQNAMASTYSGAIIRTTHLTGVLTDLGVLIGHYFQRIKIDPRRIKLFLILITGFFSGGIAGAFLYKVWRELAMLAPAIVVGASSLGYAFFKNIMPEQSSK